MLLRQPMLIFNFPGKKNTRSSLLASKTYRKLKFQTAIMLDGFFPASKVKKKKKKLRNPSQCETEFGVCQPAVAEASYEPASKVSFNTLPRKRYK